MSREEAIKETSEELNFTEEKMVKVFDYLDNLRDSGITNMFGAGPYIESTFRTKKRVSRVILAAWMNSYGN